MKKHKTTDELIKNSLQTMDKLRIELNRKNDLNLEIKSLENKLAKRESENQERLEKMRVLGQRLRDEELRLNQLREIEQSICDKVANANSELRKIITQDGAQTLDQLLSIAKKASEQEDKLLETIIVAVEDGVRMGLSNFQYPVARTCGLVSVQSCVALKPGYAIIILRAGHQSTMKLVKPGMA